MSSSKAALRIGCQTYTWEMLGPEWHGSPDDILDAVAEAGYAGVEFSNNMIGPYWDRPAAFANALQKRNLACAAFAYATTGFTDARSMEKDLAGAVQGLRFAAHLAVPLCLGGPSSDSREDYDNKLSQACVFYRRVAELGKHYGATVALHPHSHHTSLVLTPEEYDRLLSATEAAGVMFNPDTGHLMRGGHDPLACFKKYAERIVHVHLKDADRAGRWQPFGKGAADFPSLLEWLRQIGYRGWIIVEEESDVVWKDARGAIAEDRAYLRSLGA